jgi:phosphatidylserine/phosphatidylglycerophosphate/cardiolipin synthase-like enzyme
MPGRYRFYAKTEYFNELIRLISETGRGDRVALASMSLDTLEPQVNKILEELTRAAARGAQVSLAIDAFSFLTAGQTLRPGPLFWHNRLHGRMSGRFGRQLRSLDKLKLAGGHYAVTNRPTRPFTLPFTGRSHMKFAVINDTIFIGGCNLNAASHHDLMVGWQDANAAGWLYGLAAKMVAAPSVRQALESQDISRPLPDGSKILVDCGVQRQSLVYREALALIDQAEKSIFLACQYHPNSITLKHLTAAVRRGVKVTVVYNNAFKRGIIRGSLHQTVIIRERLRTPASLFNGRRPLNLPYLHAKLLATDKGSIIGSHNFIPAGVNFGTAEIALFNPREQFGKDAIKALASQSLSQPDY